MKKACAAHMDKAQKRAQTKNHTNRPARHSVKYTPREAQGGHENRVGLAAPLLVGGPLPRAEQKELQKVPTEAERPEAHHQGKGLFFFVCVFGRGGCRSAGRVEF